MNPFAWLWEQLGWLVGLAKPEKLKEALELGGSALWVKYLLISGIIFSETGLLIGFFLPGDSLLFAAGLLASRNVFDIVLLDACLMAAAIAGDAVNYTLGHQLGERVFEKGRLRLVKHEHLIAAKDFYERHGAIAIVLARFVPLVRTFTPFVAGVARMRYRQFAVYNILGGIGWVASMTLAGYFLGNIDFIRDHFEGVVVGIVLLSIVPVGIAFLKARFGPKSTPIASHLPVATAPPETTAGKPK